MQSRSRFCALYCLLPVVLVGLLAVSGFVFVVGPWPVYRDSHYAEQPYFHETLARMEASAARSVTDREPGRLHAGWAEVDMTPPVGTPMAGYSGRPNNKRSTGIHDPVFSRALVLSDGRNTVALVGADLLLVSPNVAEKVWDDLAADTPFTQDNILFTVSHTHCGPGGFGPGLVAEFSFGEYDPAIEQLIADSIAQSIREAYADMAPAGLAHTHVEAPEYIRNRTNVEGIDPLLGMFVVEKETGERCYAVRYSAHTTVLPQTFLEISAEYSGVLVRELAERTGHFAIFLGGAVGAMGPNPPEGATPVERMEAMGAALADRVLEHDGEFDFDQHLEIRSFGAEVGMPPLQVRPANLRDWRVSPNLAPVVGLPTESWIQGVRVGPILFLGTPYDFGGAIAWPWAQEAADNGVVLWVSSLGVAYSGYLTPDKYYWEPTEGYDQDYEWRLMDWFGPNQEAMWTDFRDHAYTLLGF